MPRFCAGSKAAKSVFSRDPENFFIFAAALYPFALKLRMMPDAARPAREQQRLVAINDAGAAAWRRL